MGPLSRQCCAPSPGQAGRGIVLAFRQAVHMFLEQSGPFDVTTAYDPAHI
jgi:hypothetical protein